jgi:apolipoprotein N-acyltransferase
MKQSAPSPLTDGSAAPRKLSTASAHDRWSYIWLLIGGGLLLVSNGRWIIPLAAWLAPIFLIRFARSQPVLKGLGLLLAVNVLASLFVWQGIIPGGLYLPVASGVGVVFWLPYLADRLLVGRLRGFAAALVFPLLQVSLEYITTIVSPLGSWGSLAYTQRGFLPLLQLLSITGMWGLSFLIAWLAPVVNWAWEQDFALRRARIGVLAYCGILALVLAYGGARMEFFPPQSATLQAASLTQAVDHFSLLSAKDPRASREQFLELGERLLRQSRQQAQVGADVIIWQEGAMIALKEDEARFIEQARALAREEKVHLLLGLVTIHEGFPEIKADNQAIWITPSGDVKWRYLKGRPVPGEPVVAGDGAIPVDRTRFGAIASVICFDMDHPVYIRQAGRAGTDVMLVPANDWPDIVPFHTYMASFRGIENGFSVVRAAGHGLSAAFDYQGRALATADYSATKQAMISHVPARGGKTIYAAIGDLFAWLCIAGFLALWGLALIRPTRANGERSA